MNIDKTPIEGCYLIKPKVFKDDRGSFMETYNSQTFTELTGLNPKFVQDNQSVSAYGTVRGLHFQEGKYAQSKLVRVIEGEVLDLVVDLRPLSKTFKKSFSIKLSKENNFQLFIPRGLAHGFSVLKQNTIFCYKCDNFYHKGSERGIRYNDPELNLDWHLNQDDMILSKKDKDLPTLREYLDDRKAQG
ncbi:dTDP-4-dehydrorhamnose 3,5-epimerase [Gangjinia marincola]|uniref:dTDP-4-dehydrorhamnose 3,5-epimerase n=1 Tax=Gangjinia marincola TaxID=578463 RepID=A0ABN1MII5_9FLAO